MEYGNLDGRSMGSRLVQCDSQSHVGRRRWLTHPVSGHPSTDCVTFNAITEAFRHWRHAKPGPQAPDPFLVGVISPDILAALAARDLAPSTGVITAARADLGHATRAAKRTRGAALSDADIDRLPEVLAYPRAVLLEINRGNPMLLYVFDTADGGDRAGKFVVRVGRPTSTGREQETNRFRTAGYVSLGDLRSEQRYTLLDGALCNVQVGRAGTEVHLIG